MNPRNESLLLLKLRLTRLFEALTKKVAGDDFEVALVEFEAIRATIETENARLSSSGEHMRSRM